MLYYVEQGEAIIHCNSNHINAKAGDLMIINSNDIHYMENIGTSLIYYTIKIDFAFLFGNQLDLADTALMNTLVQNRIRFKNDIHNNDEVVYEVSKIINEYKNHATAYEILVKASVYNIVALLMRSHIETIIDRDEKRIQHQAMSEMRTALEYIYNHYYEQLTLEQLASMSSMSKHHFCRVFKKFTGKSLIDFINHLRINKAMSLLQETDLNITEVAIMVGFNDSNYFSRLFKKYKNTSPTNIQR
jgi:AraC-like DNA-binding protein